MTIEYPLELTPYQKEEPSSEALDIIKLKDNSNFILSMISPYPPFAPIDYKEVMEEFYKKVPKALVQSISPIQSREIEDIENRFLNQTITIGEERKKIEFLDLLRLRVESPSN